MRKYSRAATVAVLLTARAAHAAGQGNLLPPQGTHDASAIQKIDIRNPKKTPRLNPGPGNPAQTNPPQSNSSEAKPGEAKPGEARPGEARPDEASPGEVKPGEAKPGEASPGEVKPGEAKPGEAKPGEAKPGEAKPTITVLDRLEVVGILGKEVCSGNGANMGRIVDVIVDRNGQVRAAIIDVGGFLGVGNRKVAVAWSALRFPPDPSDPKKIGRISVDLSREQVQAAPEYKEDKPVVVLGKSGGLEQLPFP